MPFTDKLYNGETLTRENFTAPPRALGILPFWFWNGELDNEELEWQLRQYQEKGIPGIFIHGRFGLKVPYVSDRWFEKVAYAVGKAKEIGIDAWIYDEMNWPSGTAERQVLKHYPHLKQKYLELVALNVDGPLFTFLEATDDRYVNTGDSNPIAAYGCTEEEFQNGISKVIDLTQNLSFNKVIPWEAPEGKWRLLYFLEKEVPYYIDALDPESTRRFIEITHERYKAAVGKEFGATVPGFFTDEPAMHYYHVGIDNYVVPWSRQMLKIFRQRRGYDLKPFLPALYTSMGPKTAQIRYDFWRTLTEQYSETYYKQLRDWCDKNNVLFTGHLLFEEWLRMHARCEGNIFHHLKHMHIIGVDHLYPKIGTEQEPDQHVALKIASSAAHHFGSTRLICESMGGTYWDCSLERMKWILNWEYVLGVNLFNNHGYHYSIEGERKRDWPPSQFYHHTWWNQYQRFTDYAARLSHILSGGRHVAKVLVVYPLSSIWTNYVPQKRTAIGNAIEFDFNYLTDTLLRLHYDYDYVDEDVLAQAAVKGGTLRIADEEYSVVILPPMTHMKRASFEKLRSFVAAGGSLIADTLLPVEFLESSRNQAASEVKRLFGADPQKVLDSFATNGSASKTLVRKHGKGTVTTILGGGLHRAKPKQQLQSILSRCITPDVTVSDEEVFYLHRVKDGFHVYFLVNTAKHEKRDVQLSFEQTGQPELWNATTGAVAPLRTFSVKNNRVEIRLDFPPSESHVIVFKNPITEPYVAESTLTVHDLSGRELRVSQGRRATGHLTIVDKKKTRKVRLALRKALPPITLKGDWDFSPEGDNAFLISGWKMAVGESPGCERPEFDDTTWIPVTQGAWEMQLPQERDEPHYPVVLWYRTSFEADVVPNDLRLLIDGFSGSEFRLFLNGTEIKDKGRRSRLDAEIKEVDIATHVRAGRNTVVVRLVAQRRTDGILDPLKLVGTFEVRSRGGALRMVKPGGRIAARDWTRQGFPYLSGTGLYRKTIQLPRSYRSGRVYLEAECGEDVLAVRVNGGETLVAPWHPYRLDVTPHLRDGANTIEILVTNTLINILEGVQNASGLLSAPRLVHEHEYTITI